MITIDPNNPPRRETLTISQLREKFVDLLKNTSDKDFALNWQYIYDGLMANNRRYRIEEQGDSFIFTDYKPKT